MTTIPQPWIPPLSSWWPTKVPFFWQLSKFEAHWPNISVALRTVLLLSTLIIHLFYFVYPSFCFPGSRPGHSYARYAKARSPGLSGNNVFLFRVISEHARLSISRSGA